MGRDKIRHFRQKTVGGVTRFYWEPSSTVAALGLSSEALGTDFTAAKKRAIELNTLADTVRIGTLSVGPLVMPGTVQKLFADFKASDEFKDLKPRTQRDYAYYLEKIEVDFGKCAVRLLTARWLKTYYKRIRDEVSVTWAYHVMAVFRSVLTWAVSEDWIEANPALDVRVKAPQKRRVMWKPEQTAIYLEKAMELGWHSIFVMVQVFDCIGQSPVDVIGIQRGSYVGSAIAITRAKTGVSDAPIPLWAHVKQALDDYLQTRPRLLPNAPIFVNDVTGEAWNENTLQKKHRIIRRAAGLPEQLQLQDFRRTAATEAGAAGATADEIRALQRHLTRDAALHYVVTDDRFVTAAQNKRMAMRKTNNAE